MTARAMQLYVPKRPLRDDVRAFFASRQASFGAMNLLSRHLPAPERVHQLVKNVMTVDYAIGRALGLPAYVQYVKDFAEYWGLSAAPVTLLDQGRRVYVEHFGRLSALGESELAGLVESVAGDTMDTFNLFSPKQCNLACRGCYAAAVPVDKKPFDDEQVATYFEGAKRVIAQARALGAKTVYTSGDGELTIFPKFFDLLEHIEGLGMKWLFFTAGLSFSSEPNAVETWKHSRESMSPHIARRIREDIERFAASGERKPVAKALLFELARHRDAIEVYHSIWSTDPKTNTQWRQPRIDDYDYVSVAVRGATISLPSSVLDMMEVVFPGEHRASFGIEMPVSHVSAVDLGEVAAFVVDNGLKSYFEPAISTGHNKGEQLAPVADDYKQAVAPLLVRSLCSFRNLHQPTVKLWHDGSRSTFRISPGMGVDVRDLERAGIGEALTIDMEDGGFFAAVHSPLIVHANYAFVTGCKCNDFSKRLLHDRENLTREWQDITRLVDTKRLTSESVIGALRARSLSGAPA
jgi:hypothetical protein